MKSLHKVGFLFVKMKVLDSQQIWLGMDESESDLYSNRMYDIQKKFVSQGVYVVSFAEHVPFHRQPERIIEKLMTYIVFTCVNLGHALVILDAKAGDVIKKEICF